MRNRALICACSDKLVKPVAVREAQEHLEVLADHALEAAHRVGVLDVEPVERFHQAVGKHQQRRFLQVRDQEQQEVLMAELGEHAASRCR